MIEILNRSILDRLCDPLWIDTRPMSIGRPAERVTRAMDVVFGQG